MLSVVPEVVQASGVAEAAIGATTAAVAAGASPALLGVLPMSADPDAIAFNEVLRACGAAYLGVVSEHAAQRGAFSGAQGLSSAVYTAGEATSAAALTL